MIRIYNVRQCILRHILHRQHAVHYKAYKTPVQLLAEKQLGRGRFNRGCRGHGRAGRRPPKHSNSGERPPHLCGGHPHGCLGDHGQESLHSMGPGALPAVT